MKSISRPCHHTNKQKKLTKHQTRGTCLFLSERPVPPWPASSTTTLFCFVKCGLVQKTEGPLKKWAVSLLDEPGNQRRKMPFSSTSDLETVRSAQKRRRKKGVMRGSTRQRRKTICALEFCHRLVRAWDSEVKVPSDSGIAVENNWE